MKTSINKKKRFLAIPIFLAVFAAAIAIVMLLWNALIPSIVGWAAINFWQAAGLMILCRLLLGGFGRFGKFGRFGRHGHHHHHSFNNKEDMGEFRNRMKHMSRDERREFILKRMRPEFSEEEGNVQPEK